MSDECCEIIHEQDGIYAVRHDTFISVQSNDGEIYFGDLPLDATADDIESAVRFYHNGLKHGTSVGIQQARHQILVALGLTGP